MLISKIAPLKSSIYLKCSNKVKSLDFILDYQPLTWFGLWTMFIAGMASLGGKIDRYHYWDWTTWLVGMVSLLILTYLVAVLLLKPKRVFSENVPVSMKYVLQIICLGVFLFLLGWGVKILGIVFQSGSVLNLTENYIYYSKNGLIASLPYISVFVALVLVNTIAIKTNKKNELELESNSTKIKYYITALCLLFLGLAGGFFHEDPVLTIAVAVTIPFIGIATFFKAVRHVQRARIYPIFIMTMFVSLREPWFLIPLGLLFYTLRFYHYFRSGIVYPTFGVDLEE